MDLSYGICKTKLPIILVEIEDKYLVDIYLNLYTLFIVLYTKNEQYRAV